MFYKDEAQRVIAISLGKIASYRNQRGGSSLHKNLMVANVLHKVRSYVSEDQIFVWEQPLDRICIPESAQLRDLDDCNIMPSDSDSRNPNFRPNEATPVMFSKSGHLECSDAAIGSFLARDAVNGCGFGGIPISDYAAECEISSTDNEFSYTQLKSGVDSRVSYDTDEECYPETVTKTRCLKRRQDIDEQDTVYAKRQKFDNEFVDVNDTSWRLQPAISDTDSESESDSVDVDQESSASSHDDSGADSEQICSLVSVFKYSFQGLGLIDNSEIGASEAEPSSDYGYPNSHLFIQDLPNTCGSEGKTNTLRRGLSLPDLCAKQADLACQTFQLTTPVLALTV